MRALALLCALAPLSAVAEEKVDLATVHRIKAEAFQNGKVMDHLFWLTDANGPRLTNSPGYKTAADWAVKTLKGWGATNPRLEKWGTFGRGWSLERFSLDLVSPVSSSLGGMPLAWSGGTNGAVVAEPVLVPLFLKSERDDRLDLKKVAARIAQYAKANKGKLRGRFVMLREPRDFSLPKEPAAERFDDTKLANVAQAPDPEPAPPIDWIDTMPTDPAKRRALFANMPTEISEDFWERLEAEYDKLNDFFRAEEVAGVLMTDDRGEGGLVFAESVGRIAPGAPVPVPTIAVPPEGYNRIARLLEKKVPVRLALELQVKFHDETDGFNVVAELPGGKKKDEVVMLGAHLDSWHAATGATDNGAGVAVALEAVRILRALKLPLDRTVRLALWSGEEQGLFGSRGYVREHFGDPVSMRLKPEHAKLSAYFNLDNGSGKIRGVHLQGNDMARPIFEAWLAPFRDLGATTVSIRNTGGTDHQSFDAVGLPGFQFIQDPLDYGTRTHHSALDVYDHAQASDLMQAAAVMAAFVYQAANRAELLPRKPLPAPLPPKKKRAEAP